MMRLRFGAWQAPIRIVWCLAATTATLTAAQADPSFSCQAKGEAWHVTGSSTSKMSCQFTCALDGGADSLDHVTCTATVYPGMPSNVPCQGFLLGKRWTSGELVAEQCSETQ